MDRVRFISHRDKQILLIDMTKCKADQVIRIAGDVKSIVTAQPPSSVCILADFTGTKFSRDAITRMKEVAVYDRPYVRRAAFVGADSLPQVYYDALKRFSQREFPIFNTREEALDWLVRD